MCLLSPFRAVTGRNRPSNTEFVFGPRDGWGLAYIDFSSQEIVVAVAFSEDERMSAGYAAGDPYLVFAKTAHLVPADATKASHKAMHDRCKVVVLGHELVLLRHWSPLPFPYKAPVLVRQ